MSDRPPTCRFSQRYYCDECGATIGYGGYDDSDMSVLTEKVKIGGKHLVDQEVLEVTLKFEPLSEFLGWYSRPKWRTDKRQRYTDLFNTIQSFGSRRTDVSVIITCADLCSGCFAEQVRADRRDGWVCLHKLSLDGEEVESIQKRTSSYGTITRREPVRIRYRRV